MLKENISIEKNFNESILRIKRTKNNHCYVYKKINRSFYEFNDI